MIIQRSGDGTMDAASFRAARDEVLAWLRYVGDILRRMPGDRYVGAMRRYCAPWPDVVAERQVDYAPETTLLRRSGVTSAEIAQIDVFIGLLLRLPAEDRRTLAALAMRVSARAEARADPRRRSATTVARRRQQTIDFIVDTWRKNAQ